MSKMIYMNEVNTYIYMIQENTLECMFALQVYYFMFVDSQELTMLKEEWYSTKEEAIAAIADDVDYRRQGTI